MAIKHICDRCGSEINPYSSRTKLVTFRGSGLKAEAEIEVCVSCAFQLKAWLNNAPFEMGEQHGHK